MRCLLIAVALAFLPISPLSAQVPQPPEPGDRIRVSTGRPPGGPDWIVGTLVEIMGDRLTLRPDREGRSEVELARDALTRMEVSRGRRAGSRWRRGLGLGFLAGAVAGAVVVPLAVDEEASDLSTGDAVLLGAGYGGVGGGLIGTLVGFTIKVERWEEVPLAGSGGVSPFGGELRFTASLGFPF